MLLTVLGKLMAAWAFLDKQFYISDLYRVQIFHWWPKSLVQDCILWSDLLAITTWTNRKLKVLVLLRGRVQQSDWSDLGHLRGNGSTHTVCESACCENSVVIGNWSFNTVAVLCTSGWCGCHSNNFSTFSSFETLSTLKALVTHLTAQEENHSACSIFPGARIQAVHI